METITISKNLVKNKGGLVKFATETFRLTVPAHGQYASRMFVFRASGRPAEYGIGEWRIDVWSGSGWNLFASADEIKDLDACADMPADVEKNIKTMIAYAEKFAAAVS